MRLTAFASRNTKEILRDPLTFCFGLGFPVVLLLLLSAINSAIPEQAQMTMFNIDKLTPGITVFGMSFISLFSSMLIAKDRTTSFMMRLFTSPLKAHEFIIGYTLPLLPMAILQSAVCVVVAFFLGLEVSVNILLMLAVNIPIAIVFISLGLDVIARHSLWVEIEKLKGKITVILTTHYLEEAVALCDRIGIMAHSKFMAEGTADELVALSGEKEFESAFVKLTNGGAL
ncbi:MAG: ABC transporter permease [Ruminococcus bromii]